LVMSAPPAQRLKQDKFGILDSVKLYASDFDESVGAHGIAVIYFDLDNFKSLNTRFTETVIDRELLPKLQRMIDALVVGHGFAYAEGGDEFVIMLPNTGIKIATAFAEELLDRIRSLEFTINGEVVSVTASAGLATAATVGAAQTCREAANVAKRTAKEEGKDRLVVAGVNDAARSSQSGVGTLVVDANRTSVLLESRLYDRLRVDDADRNVTVVLACDGAAEAALRDLATRSRVELTYGNHWLRGTLEGCRFTHEGAQQIATVTITKRDDDRHQGYGIDMGWGGHGGDGALTADQIAELRARRLLTGEPRAKKDEFGGPDMLIRGMGQDGLKIVESPIPGLLGNRSRNDRATWDHLRLELVRQLILSHCVERVEHLRLNVQQQRLVHIDFKGTRHRAYAHGQPVTIAVEQAVSF
jgi:diguanylate cyclase (GGDEF)-like protein